MIRKYQNLKVWEKATELALEVYAAIRQFPKEEIYGMTSQIRRAAVSIPSNIAESSERKSDKEFIRFLRIAASSIAEMETQLYLAFKLGYITQKIYDSLFIQTTETAKMIYGLTSKLEGRLSSDLRLATGD